MKVILFICLLVAFLFCSCQYHDSGSLPKPVNGNTDSLPPSVGTLIEKAMSPAVGLYPVSAVVENKAYVGLASPYYFNTEGGDNKWYMYDVTLDQWTRKASHPGPFRYQAKIFVIDKKVFIAGGYNAYSNHTKPGVTEHVLFNDLWEYDTETDQWTQKNKLPIDSASFLQSLVLNINNKGYLLNGNKFWAYDHSNDSWISQPDLPFNTASQECYSVSSSTLGYIHLSSGAVWVYDGNSWKNGGTLDGSKKIAFVINNVLYYTSFDPYVSNYGYPCYLWETHLTAGQNFKKVEVPTLVDNGSAKYINYRFIINGKAYFDTEYRTEVRAFYEFTP